MINAVRLLLLIIAFGIVTLAGFYFYKSQGKKVEMGNIKVKLMDKGIDVEIENFKVTHEVKGKKEWVLKAGLAQINNQKDQTRLKEVEMILQQGENRQYIIFADSGIYKNSTKDIDLTGNVKLTGDSHALADRFQGKKTETPNTSFSEIKK